MHTNFKLEEYKQLSQNVDGFFDGESAALWDALLALQAEQYVFGDMLEIGVYKGRSALLSAMHLREDEASLLIDGTPFMDEARLHLTPLLGNRAKYIERMSQDVRLSDLYELSAKRCRWIHIDGEHTGSAVARDLSLCEPLLHDGGLLILDDFFNPMYPQLTEAAFSFLSTNSFKLKLVMVAWNKAYICRPAAAAVLRAYISGRLPEELRNRGVSNFTICKTAPIDESVCFGIVKRFGDRDYYGLDSAPDVLPL
jgi:hypothetical protein